MGKDLLKGYRIGGDVIDRVAVEAEPESDDRRVRPDTPFIRLWFGRNLVDHVTRDSEVFEKVLGHGLTFPFFRTIQPPRPGTARLPGPPAHTLESTA